MRVCGAQFTRYPNVGDAIGSTAQLAGGVNHRDVPAGLVLAQTTRNVAKQTGLPSTKVAHKQHRFALVQKIGEHIREANQGAANLTTKTL